MIEHKIKEVQTAEILKHIKKFQSKANRVDQKDFPIRHVTYTEGVEDKKRFLWTSGLNPCIGVLIMGTIN